MTIQELGTIMQYNIPVKIILLNNNYLGMVRQWQELFFKERYSETLMQNPDFIKIADHIIDLGPEGGVGGGQIVAQGTPQEVAKCKNSYTGQYLKPILTNGKI